MLLFAGMMLVIVIYASPTELESMPFDLKLLYQTTTETQSPLQDEVDSTVAVRSVENGSTENINDDNESIKVVTWECGVDYLTKLISEFKIEKNCPRLKKPINQCCINHDACYNDQQGRKYCDDTFCTCLDIATNSSLVCNKRHGRTFCEIVRKFGEFAYIEAGRQEAMKSLLSKFIHRG